MAKLTKSQMRMYAAAAGFPDPAMMAEVGWAESGGDTKVVNSIGCVGVLQINQPVHVKSHPTWSVTWLQNPLNNFRAGKVLYDADKRAGGNGLRPWEDSRLKGNGGGWGRTPAYANFQKGVTSVDWDPFEEWNDPLDIWPDDAGPPPETPWEMLTGEPPNESFGSVTGTLDGLTDIAKLGVKLGEWMSNPRNWVNALYVVGGAGVIAVAVSASLRQQVVGSFTKIGKKVASNAGN